jgi:hypothetical protein
VDNPSCWTTFSARLGADWEQSQSVLVLWLAPGDHVRARGLEFWVVVWHSSFFLKNRWVCWAFLGLVPLTETGDSRKQPQADRGGNRNSAAMFSQVRRTPASGCYYLNSMTPEGQEMYLRFDQTTRRSPYRMSRILARQQLVTKIQQGELPAGRSCC